MAVLKRMSRKAIEALPTGRYWATPRAPFPLDGPNGHDEVFPGAECISDGKWVTFYKRPFQKDYSARLKMFQQTREQPSFRNAS